MTLVRNLVTPIYGQSGMPAHSTSVTSQQSVTGLPPQTVISTLQSSQPLTLISQPAVQLVQPQYTQAPQTAQSQHTGQPQVLVTTVPVSKRSLEDMEMDISQSEAEGKRFKGEVKDEPKE
ncbi:hypothetical protein ScPMuIL_005007 [Solemya velum]